MEIVFTNSENSKTSDPHRLLLNVSMFHQFPRGKIILNISKKKMDKRLIIFQ